MLTKIRTFIHRLRGQSHETRKIILVLGSFGVTALIMLAWIGSIGTRQDYHTMAAQPKTTKIQSPFSIIRDSVVELYANNQN